MKKPQPLQKNQVKREPRIMLIYLETLSKLKTTGRKNNMCHIRQILLTRMEYGRLSHQYGITHSIIEIISLDIVILAMALVTKK
jgi:hypothetical protein